MKTLFIPSGLRFDLDRGLAFSHVVMLEIQTKAENVEVYRIADCGEIKELYAWDVDYNDYRLVSRERFDDFPKYESECKDLRPG
jgi:hypothetical protein